ncbi:unnamed protein product [Acanthoscelides obtectus]|uniref:Uncharacterized protein n=1 Tax=Acanthoscelides obtectus TaxID=200917 RepID=A0A9P0L1X2_ACAOB|nr:unnamed protein product [Acanthoscelides obtectus]CAK1681933.1 Guanine nucleotide-binding protein subunit beta-like protein 1 [Acanthoscelides obtectus]
MQPVKPPRSNSMLPPDPVYTLKSDMGYIQHMNFFQGGTSQLLAATEKGLVYFWDLNTNRASCKKKMGEGILAIHSYDDKIITQEKSGIVKLWSVESDQSINSYECCGGHCKSITVGDTLVLPQEHGVDLVNKKTFEKTKTLLSNKENLGHVMALEKMEFESNTYILAGYESGDVILWDATEGKTCGDCKFQEHLTTLTFDSPMGRGVCAGASNAMQVFSIDDSFNISVKCEVSLPSEGCNIVKVRPDRNNSESPINQLRTCLRFYACVAHQNCIGDFINMHQTIYI